jgi:ribonuclease P/MRP protein subunit RPP1
MKRFADLHLRPDLDSPEHTKELIAKAKELGYSLAGISLPPRVKKDAMLLLQEACGEHKLDFATRIDLSPHSPNELLKSLKRFRRGFEIVVVNCLSKAVARQAAKDRRVDLLAFPSLDPRARFFDRAETRVASQGVAALEVDISLLLRSTGFSRVRLLSSLRREVEIARAACFPVVVSSHAFTPFQMRGPYDLACVSALFGMDNASALNAVSAVPYDIVERNRKKLDVGYVARGVHIIRRGKGCDN